MSIALPLAPPSRLRTIVLTVGAGVVLADAAIVTLALPDLLGALDTTVTGVALVLAVYTAVLAAAVLPAERLSRRVGSGPIGLWGFALVAGASVVCAAAGSLDVLLVGRGLQALGGAAALVATFERAGGADRGRREWLAAGVFGSAAGPAIGGLLTQLADWRAIFIVQAPLALAAALACRGDAPPAAEPAPRADAPRFAARPAVALGLVSAALTAVLFLLVLLLVAGWSVSPLRAAAAVTVIPLAALIGARVRGEPRVLAAVGAILIGGGVLALAWLPEPRLAWTVAPTALAGVGMGLALPALAGRVLPERTPRDAARLLAVRHIGIALLVLALGPLLANRLDASTEQAKERGVAILLDARMPPQTKLDLAPRLFSAVQQSRPRAGLRDAVAAARPDLSSANRAELDRVAVRADATVVDAVETAFHDAFLISGALAFLAAGLLLTWPLVRRFAVPAIAAGVLAAATPAVYAAAHRDLAPTPVAIQDPCKPRTVPSTGGFSGAVQTGALHLLDIAACRLGSSREELVLALADDAAARQFEQRHGVNPRSVGGLLQGLLGFG